MSRRTSKNFSKPATPKMPVDEEDMEELEEEIDGEEEEEKPAKIEMSASVKRSWWKKNFTDRAGRIDTGRIGQVFGLFFLFCLIVYTAFVIIANVELKVEQTIMASIASAFPMVLYRLKQFSGTVGTAYEYPPREDVIHFIKIRNFFEKNFTDEYGRLDTGRIGQVIGLIAMVFMTAYTMYVYTLYPLLNDGAALNINHSYLMLLGGESGFPMLMYRLKEFSAGSGGD